MKKFDNFPDAFDYCRECDKPIIVLIQDDKYKLFPSGTARLLERNVKLIDEVMVTIYRGYDLHISPTMTWFGCRICFIRRGGLSVDKAIGYTIDESIKAARRRIDAWLKIRDKKG